MTTPRHRSPAPPRRWLEGWPLRIAVADAAVFVAGFAGLAASVAPEAEARAAVTLPEFPDVADYADEPTLPVTHGPLRSIFGGTTGAERSEIALSAPVAVPTTRDDPPTWTAPEPTEGEPLSTSAPATTSTALATTTSVAPSTTTATATATQTTTVPPTSTGSSTTTTAAMTTTTEPSVTDAIPTLETLDQSPE